MNDIYVESFITASECGNISRASDQLFVSQTTLSHRIQALEDELGVTLFERSRGSRALKLTEHGQRFLPLALRWRQLHNETMDTMYAPGEHFINLAANMSIISYIFPLILAKFTAKASDTYLKIQSYPPEDCYYKITSEEISLALVSENMVNSDVTVKEAFLDEYVLVFNKDANFSEDFPISELDENKFIYQDWDQHLIQWCRNQFGSSFKARIYTDNSVLVKGILEQTKGAWTIAPLSVARALSDVSDLKYLKIKGLPQSRMVYLLYLNDDKLTERHKDLIGCIREAVTDLGFEWLCEV